MYHRTLNIYMWFVSLFLLTALLFAVTAQSLWSASPMQEECPHTVYLPAIQVVHTDPAPTPVSHELIVDAGQTQAVTLADSVLLSGSVSYDGVANPPCILAAEWSKQSGPGTVTFGQKNKLNTPVAFSQKGDYILQLTARVNSVMASATVDIMVDDGNLPPVVDAGVPQTVTLPGPVSLIGTVNDDELPTPHSLTVTWSKAEGPGAVTFADSHAVSTNATFSQTGTYVLMLQANDTEKASSDTVTIVVTEAKPLAGHWVGTTDQDLRVAFDVSVDSTQWSTFTLQVSGYVSGCPVSVFTTITATRLGPGPIVDNQFSSNGGMLSFTGKFTSTVAANGTYVYTASSIPIGLPYPPFICFGYMSKSGTWQAQHEGSTTNQPLFAGVGSEQTISLAPPTILDAVITDERLLPEPSTIPIRR